MNKLLSKAGVLAAILLLSFSFACEEDEPPLPDNVVTFTASSSGLDHDVSEADVVLSLSRAVSNQSEIFISFTTDGVTYGEHFVTDPAATEGSLQVTIPAGASSASFKVIRIEDAFTEGDESVTFTITQAGDPLVIGAATEFVLSFSSIVSKGSELQLEGLDGSETAGGADAANSVFIDLSNNQQTAIARNSWDLGFFSGDPFRVVLNKTTGASAVKVDKTDINAVTVADINTDDLEIPLGIPGDASFTMIDDVHGDLTKTVIAEVSATDNDNAVYVINRVNGGHGSTIDPASLVKVRILRNANGGYTLQHANLGESTFKSIDIPKKEKANFSYISFTENGSTATEVAVAPANWDIEWTWSMYYGDTPAGSYPYGFSDLVFVNHIGGVKVAEVLTTTTTYEAFGEADLSGVELLAARNVIGSNWRVTSPADKAGVRTDRFYVVQDAAGNIYKVKFVSFHPNDGGTRGKPVIAYALVKAAE